MLRLHFGANVFVNLCGLTILREGGERQRQEQTER
jgi:hypothetical protein